MIIRIKLKKVPNIFRRKFKHNCVDLQFRFDCKLDVVDNVLHIKEQTIPYTNSYMFDWTIPLNEVKYIKILKG